VYDPRGHLIKQIVLEGDEELEHAIPSSDKKSSHSPVIDRSSISRSVAITGDDRNVYLMRATEPPTVYAISPTGEVLHKIVAPSPADAAWPRFGIRVIKNKLLLEFYRECSNRLDSGSCKGTVLSVLEASTGKPLVNYEPEETAGSVIACYVPDPDRFFIFERYRLFSTVTSRLLRIRRSSSIDVETSLVEMSREAMPCDTCQCSPYLLCSVALLPWPKSYLRPVVRAA
jgi:hypothetical protein